jgi:hypothetical protein
MLTLKLINEIKDTYKEGVVFECLASGSEIKVESHDFIDEAISSAPTLCLYNDEGEPKGIIFSASKHLISHYAPILKEV